MFSNCSEPGVVRKQIATFDRGGMSTRNQCEVVTDCKNISYELFGYFFNSKFLDWLVWYFIFIGKKLFKA